MDCAHASKLFKIESLGMENKIDITEKTEERLFEYIYLRENTKDKSFGCQNLHGNLIRQNQPFFLQEINLLHKDEGRNNYSLERDLTNFFPYRLVCVY